MTVRAVRLADAARGERPECVLLHGNPGSLLDFAALVPSLAEVANLLVIDLPGFGRSERPSRGSAELSLTRLADDVLAVSQALGVAGPLVVIGHSHGGGVAQTLAARHPERVSKLIAIATLGSPAQVSYRLLRLPGAAKFVRAAGRVFRAPRLAPLARLVLRVAMRDFYSPEGVDAERLERELDFLREYPRVLESMVDVAQGDPEKQLLSGAPAIRCPALFLHGERDALVPPSHALTLHEAIVAAGGQSEFRLVGAAGHMLMEQRAPELCAEILAFLASEAR